MSTILDALKKSEQERKLNNIPTLSDLPAPEETNRFSRAWLICGLVLIGLMLLVLVFLLSDRFVNSSEFTPSKPIAGTSDVEEPQPLGEDEIAINVVSWSEDTGQRFVIINGKLVRENEFAAPGLKVIEIKRESVIINFRGKRIEKRP